MVKKKKKNNPATVTLHFALERDTKNFRRYMEVDAQGNEIDKAEAAVGTLYLRRGALGDDTPDKVVVVIRPEGEEPSPGLGLVA